MVVRRAQLGTNPGHSLEREMSKLGRIFVSLNARPLKALARANGTSRRASGWAGEKVARSGKLIGPPFI